MRLLEDLKIYDDAYRAYEAATILGDWTEARAQLDLMVKHCPHNTCLHFIAEKRDLVDGKIAEQARWTWRGIGAKIGFRKSVSA